MKDLDLAAVNLTVDDRDPQAIFDAARATFSTLAPTAQLRNATIEAFLMEALATASADVIYALNRVISLVVEGLFNLYNVPRFPGSAATGVITLTLDGSRNLTVAAGQRLQDPTTGLILEVTATTTVTTASTISVPAATITADEAGNSITIGSAIDLLDSIPYVVSAHVTTAFTGGADPETDAAYVDRVSTRLARVNASLGMAEHFTAFALEDPRVSRATTIDLYQPGGIPGSDKGFVTVYTYGRGGQLATDVRAELQVAMAAQSISMITPFVEEASLVTQALTLTVHAMAGYSTTAVRDDVTAALAAWMSPKNWDWGRDIMITEIIDVAADVPGVDYVDSVDLPTGTVGIAGYQLAQAGTITVTVTT